MKIKSKILIFIGSFTFMLVSSAMMLHLWPFLGRDAMSWNEIFESAWIFVIASITFGVIVIIAIEDAMLEIKKIKESDKSSSD